MNIQPLADRVVLQQLDAEETTASGIILPDSAKEKPAEGKVMAVGADVKEVKTGDTVLYSKYGPTEVKIDNQEYMVVKEEEILAIIKGGK
jgi:chaperonin GroES